MGQRRRHTLERSLAAIENASRAELNALFREEFGRKPAPRASLEFLRQNLAWAAQAKATDQNPEKRQKDLIRGLQNSLDGPSRGSVPYRPGTRLVREWQGVVYEVTVLEDGYSWEGRVYPNLTRIATEITGTKWSGPRFFGLKGGKDGDK